MRSQPPFCGFFHACLFSLAICFVPRSLSVVHRVSPLIFSRSGHDCTLFYLPPLPALPSLRWITSVLYLMPLPLYGSGFFRLLRFAAIWPTSCLSTPFSVISVCLASTVALIPFGIGYTIGWEKPRLSIRFVPWACALKPTPLISRDFSYPLLTPVTMLAIRFLVSPCSSRYIFWSDGRSTTRWLFSFLTVSLGFTDWLISPSGPFTVIFPVSSFASTPAGISIGFLPTLDITTPNPFWDEFTSDKLPYVAEHFSAYIILLCLLSGLYSLRRGENGGSESGEDLRDRGIPSIHAATRTAHSLNPLNNRQFIFGIFQVDADHTLPSVF